MRLVWILVIVLVGLLAGGLFTRLERAEPEIRTRATPTYIGDAHAQEFRVLDEGMGVKNVRVWLESGDETIDLFSETYDGNVFMGADLGVPRRVQVEVKPKELGLGDGNATLSAEATDYSWFSNSTRVDVPIVIDTKAPRVSVRTGLTYVRRGGSEMVVYALSEDAPVHGVEISERVFPGYPHPEGDGRFVAFYPLAPDAPPGTAPAVIAEDRAGNRTRVGVPISIIERSFPNDTIRLSKGFLQNKVPELLGGENEDLLASYLKINREMRAENAEQIRKICEESSTERLWRGAFQQLPNSNVGARFAEHRRYTYEGSEVDQQTHMGYDLASTAHSPIPAANAGVIAFADNLGIYGQTVIIDHGMGLFSLYGHLSEISVEKGSVVAQGETIGNTGSTGLAGGDHLHYAMMLDGVFVDPLEWFDGKWIREHLETKFASEQNGTGPSS